MRLLVYKRFTRKPRTRSVRVLWLAFAFAGVLGLTCICVSAPDAAPKSPAELVAEVVQKLSQNRVTRIEILYLDWGASVYGGVSEDRLLTHHQYKIVVANPRWNAAGLRQALDDFQFRQVDFAALEFRIACTFYVGSEEIVTLFFAGNVPVVSIRQELFRAEPGLLSAIVAFLPHEAYERMYGAILSQWVYSHDPRATPTEGNGRGQ